MKNYILVYFVDDYPEMGGGIKFESFKHSDELDERVSEVWRHQILAVGELNRFTYKEVEIVTKVVRE